MTVLVSDDDVSQSQCSQVWRAELLTKCTFTIDSCSKITSNNRHCIAARDMYWEARRYEGLFTKKGLNDM